MLPVVAYYSTHGFQEEVVCPDHRTPLVVIEALSDCSSLRVVHNLLSSAGFIPGSDGSAFTNTLYPDAALTLLAKNKSITRVSARFQIVGLQREHHLANVTTIDAVSPLFPPHTSLDLVYTWADGYVWYCSRCVVRPNAFSASSCRGRRGRF